MTTSERWAALDTRTATQLGDSRRQLHHAAQFATAMGISYLPHAADDSHTNLEWLPAHRALASHSVTTPHGSTQLGLRLETLTLLVLRDGNVVAQHELLGETIGQVAEWIRPELERAGLDAGKYTLVRHFEIPSHPVESGAPFSADAAQLDQLARWFGNSAQLLESLRATNDGTTVRCWPHHFDIATLITPREGTSIGVGLEPGDTSYDEPYFYVNAYPQPTVAMLTGSLEGQGIWHTSGWIGAVLPASRVDADASRQAGQVHSFLDSAVRACRALASLSP